MFIQFVILFAIMVISVIAIALVVGNITKEESQEEREIKHKWLHIRDHKQSDDYNILDNKEEE